MSKPPLKPIYDVAEDILFVWVRAPTNISEGVRAHIQYFDTGVRAHVQLISVGARKTRTGPKLPTFLTAGLY